MLITVVGLQVNITVGLEILLSEPIFYLLRLKEMMCNFGWQDLGI
jgi:hypothetical protein